MPSTWSKRPAGRSSGREAEQRDHAVDVDEEQRFRCIAGHFATAAGSTASRAARAIRGTFWRSGQVKPPRPAPMNAWRRRCRHRGTLAGPLTHDDPTRHPARAPLRLRLEPRRSSTSIAARARRRRSTSAIRCARRAACSRSRWFAIGMLVALGAWVLHVAALALAPMSVVQAVARRRRRAARRDGRAPVRLPGRPPAVVGPRPHRARARPARRHAAAARTARTRTSRSPAMIAFEAGLLGVGGLLIMGPRVGAPDQHHGVMLGAAAGVLFGVSRRRDQGAHRPRRRRGVMALAQPLDARRARRLGRRLLRLGPRPAGRRGRPGHRDHRHRGEHLRHRRRHHRLRRSDARHRLGIVLQAVAFVLVIVASALTPAPRAAAAQPPARHAAGARRGLEPRVRRSRPRPDSDAARRPSLSRGNASPRPSPSDADHGASALEYGCPDRTAIGRTANGGANGDDDVRYGRPRACRSWRKRHLWMHFSRMGAYDAAPRSRSSSAARAATSGTSTATATSTALSSLFCANIGHGRADIAQAGADQAQASSTSSRTGPTRTRRAIELAAKIASLTPGDLNRVFFTSGGSEAVESALKLARQYHKLTGNPNKTKVIAREVAYHGTTLGALTRDRHHRACARRSSRSRPAAATSRTRTSTGCPRAYGAENLAEAIAAADRVRGAGDGRAP